LRVRDFIRGLAQTILAAATTHAYFTLLITIAIEEAGVPLPVPGDLVIAFYGWRAGGDAIEIAKTILVCAAASTIGTQAPYWIARRWGRPVTERVAFWLDIDITKIDQLLVWIDRHGFRAVLMARLIPGLRVTVSFVAGTARVPPLQFAGGVFVAATIYWTLWVLLGAALGPEVARTLRPAYLRVIVIAIPVVVVGLFVTRLVIAQRRRRRATSGGTPGGQA
jgi:membrane protein DedA with SNARE-associated domain